MRTTFLQAVTASTGMAPEKKAFWRERCFQHYLEKLLAWARAHPNSTVEESEWLMLCLCEGRTPEQLEYWCAELHLLEEEKEQTP